MKKRNELREEALLLSLLREDSVSAKRQVSLGLDWEQFGALAVRYSLAPYFSSLYASRRTDDPSRSEIRDLIPQPLGKRFETALRETGYHNLHLTTSLRPFLGSLRDHRIVPIILKGAALLGRVYADHGARLLSDLDILVPQERAAETLGLAQAAGLIEYECDQRSDRRFGFQTRGPVPAKLEVHWDLSQRYRFQADIPGLWERSIPFDFEEIPARRLAPTDEFLYLALHYAAHYFPASLKWLVDLRELLRSDPPDARELSARAASWHGESVLSLTLVYLRQIYPHLELPAITRTSRMSLREALIKPFLSDEPLLFVQQRRRGPGRLLMGLLFVDRPMDMVRLAWVTHMRGEGHDHPGADVPDAPDHTGRRKSAS